MLAFNQTRTTVDQSILGLKEILDGMKKRNGDSRNLARFAETL
jgi:hypothetical protein